MRPISAELVGGHGHPPASTCALRSSHRENALFDLTHRSLDLTMPPKHSTDCSINGDAITMAGILFKK